MNDTIKRLRDDNLKNQSAVGVTILDAFLADEPHPLKDNPPPAITPAPFRPTPTND